MATTATLDNIRHALEQYVGNKILLKADRGRKQIVTKKGVLETLISLKDETAAIPPEKDLSENEYEKLLLEIIDINKNHSIDLIPHTFWKLCIKHKINRVHLPLKIFQDLYNEKNAEFLSFFDTLGVSVHTVDEAILAEKLGATYLVFGHIFSTDCKKNLEPKGIENLKYICESVSIPVYAIGGIDETNAYTTIKNGAYGVCMMSNIMKKV